MKIFGAIYIGSYIISLKVYEIGGKKGIKVLDKVEYRNDIEKDIMRYGYITNETIADTCESLNNFKSVLNTYLVTDYQVYITPAVNKASNRLFVKSQIEAKTGLFIRHLANSEQKLLYFKALMETAGFERISKENILVVSVGGNSIQISLMERGDMITTQLVPLSTVKMREQLAALDLPASKRTRHISDLIKKELDAFKKMYVQNIKPKYLIVIGDYVNDIISGADKTVEGKILEKELFVDQMVKMMKSSANGAGGLGHLKVSDSLAEPFIMMYQCLAESTTASYIWIPGVSVHDGIMYDYAFANKWLKPTHDFDKDVIQASKQIAKRYGNDERHDAAMIDAAMAIFDGLKKPYGLNKRSRLLLEAAIILHDCGRYVSLARRAKCAHDIIMAAEIIGLSHTERKIVANIVLYNREELPPFDEFEDNLSSADYVELSRLCAIMRLADALDSSNTQKVDKITCSVKEDCFSINVSTIDDIIFEKLEFYNKTSLFETVYGIAPQLKEHRIL